MTDEDRISVLKEAAGAMCLAYGPSTAVHPIRDLIEEAERHRSERMVVRILDQMQHVFQNHHLTPEDLRVQVTMLAMELTDLERAG